MLVLVAQLVVIIVLVAVADHPVIGRTRAGTFTRGVFVTVGTVTFLNGTRGVFDDRWATFGWSVCAAAGWVYLGVSRRRPRLVVTRDAFKVIRP